MTQAEFSVLAPGIPSEPGIYKYYGSDGELLYVGKAKSLRKRVSSYFSKTFTTYKTHELVKRISKIEFTIVNSEQDAFLLENSLIKEYQPRFNINLKDDKTYPYIVIKNEPYPRVFLTRRKINDGSVYLGPFTSVARVRELLDFVRQSIQLRNCKLSLSAASISRGKFKVCLEYHLGNCKGPCEGLQTADDYNDGLQRLKELLKGNMTPVLQYYKKLMLEQAAAMEFEKAEMTRKKIDYVQLYQARSAVVNTKTGTLDVFTVMEEGDTAYVNYLAVSNGSIVQTKTVVLHKKLEETAAEILAFAIAQLRQTFNSQATEILVPFAISYPEEGLTVTVPKSGDRKKLLELSEKNVVYFREELKKKKMLHLEEKGDTEKVAVLEQLQKDLQLPQLPLHIECFDNSNFQGAYPVSAMVCFKNGAPSKNDYRRFNVKTVKGINDFATMKEVVYRRYKRLSESNEPLPQLIIIDGGKGQLSAALESISMLGLTGKTTLVGLAKNEEELFYAGDSQSLKLAWDSQSLKLIRRIRDEVHRFGITFHRNQRSKGTFTNELEKVKGIGSATAELLLKTYKSVKNIREKTEEELTEVIGASKAAIVARYFRETSQQ